MSEELKPLDTAEMAERIVYLESVIRAADGYLEMGMRELAQNELRKALEESGE